MIAFQRMGRGLEWLAENMGEVMRACARCDEELFGACVDNADKVEATWDGGITETSASLHRHMIIGLRWYAFKALCARARRHANEVVDTELLRLVNAPVNDDHVLVADARDWVSQLATSLGEQDRVLLLLRHVNGLTFEQIGDRIGCSKNTAVKYCNRALERAREVMGVDVYGDE